MKLKLLPCFAISSAFFEITTSSAPSRTASAVFPGEVVEFSVQHTIEPGKPTWANYSKGVAAELLQAGIPLTGMDALLLNTLPVGGGLSSSGGGD